MIACLRGFVVFFSVASLFVLVSSAPAQQVSVESIDGIEVPALPDQPFNYTSVRFVARDRIGFEQADNTPADNPITDRGATLGRVLFYDTQLSRNNTVACASCHHQRAGFSDPRQFSVGFEGGRTTRNAMGLANVRYTKLRGARPGFFWDERATTLEDQVLMPIQDRIEMGMNLNDLEAKLQRLPYYPPLFEAAFGSTRVTSDHVAKAIAQFMRSMVALNSKFDRAAAKAASNSAPFDDFAAQENLGKELFSNGVGEVAEFGCAFCHVPPTFGMPKAFNNGLELHYADRGLGALDRPSNDPFTQSNDGKFKAPSLRNIELTAPYMHDGRFKTLEEVVEHYSSGVRPHANLGLAIDERDRDKPTSGFKFTDEQRAGLVAFLKTLTDAEFASDPRFSDPFVRAVDTPAEQYQRLVEEHEAGAEPRELADRFFELAKRHHDDPAAIDALAWVLTKLRSRPEAMRAIDMLAKNHLHDEKLGSVLSQIARTPAIAAEELLRAAIEKSRRETVRAQACLHLANVLEQRVAVLDQLQKQPELADRVLQYYGKDYGQFLKKLTRESLDKERAHVYEQMLKSFADVPTRDGTMGELATKALFQIRHLSIGRVAPEIAAEDIFGKEFKLSDYRGKVVVISFWGHW